MNGLMMHFPLTLPAILRRAETLFGHREIVSRQADRTLHRCTYAVLGRRARQLGQVLQELGVRPGDRVATLAWNHAHHLEAYFAIPLIGAVLHTLNLRLHPDELAYIIDHAEDQVILSDQVLLPLLQQVLLRVKRPVRVLCFGDAPTSAAAAQDFAQPLEPLMIHHDPAALVAPEITEDQAAAMCYTTGTTGHPKGVVYTHRALALHSMAICMRDVVGLGESDTVLPVVPMFHANAWGLPYAAALCGARQVHPGPHLDAHSLLHLLQDEGVTVAGGVPTVWMGLLGVLDHEPKAWDLSRLRLMLIGGSAAPPAMIRGFQERHGLYVLHAWGMTELSPLGSVSPVPADLHHAAPAEQYGYRVKQGRPAPFIEFRARSEAGLCPWDGRTMGELEVRGAWVARAYYRSETGAAQFTEDGWFRTGDIVTIDWRGYIQIQDRSKDLIKSGGEWISSVALENALMGHPAVAEAAVVAVPHPRWQERPLAAVVCKPGQTTSSGALRAYLAEHFVSWWLPDAFEFVTEIPRTSAGKFKKSALRERFMNYLVDLEAQREVEAAAAHVVAPEPDDLADPAGPDVNDG